MSGHRRFSELRDQVLARPGAAERLAEAVSQAELAGRLEITQSAVSKLEQADDVRVSTLRQYLDALGARLELVAVFDDDERRVPIHLGHSGVQERSWRASGWYRGRRR